VRLCLARAPLPVEVQLGGHGVHLPPQLHLRYLTLYAAPQGRTLTLLHFSASCEHFLRDAMGVSVEFSGKKRLRLSREVEEWKPLPSDAMISVPGRFTSAFSIDCASGPFHQQGHSEQALQPILEHDSSGCKLTQARRLGSSIKRRWRVCSEGPPCLYLSN
jgi:hypothetical protein